MAVASDYSGWVRELDKFQASADGDGAVGDDDGYDPRHESGGGRMASSRQTARTAAGGIGTSRKAMKERAPSQAEELQQEMKLLNWHKLANEAALKAAIIKTNKLKREDSHVSRSMNHEDMEEKQLRIQQIIEEEQLRPLQVNSEFFRDFETKELRDEAKLETDVQRHVQHLKRLKEMMAQREDLQRRRQKYREGVLELNGGSRANSVPKNLKSSNQDEERYEQLQQQNGSTRHQRSSSMYNGHAGRGASTVNTQVICSLDKLMELEKRIRHLEDAGLGGDALEDDPRVEHGGRGADDVDTSGNFAKAKGGGGLHFSKRRSAGGPHEPAKTMYAVKTSKPQSTFLTSLPENKQRQLRRMTERERRQFLKREKATEEREKTIKQDVVIDGWLDKKRQAATNRKAVSSQVRSAQATAGGAVRSGKAASVATATTGTASRPTGTGRRLGGRTLLPPPPKVRAPAVGAASGKRIANPHSQKFDDIKKGFERRNEALKRAPTNVRASHSLLDPRFASGSSTLSGGRSSTSNASGSKYPGHSAMDRSATQRAGAGIAALARAGGSSADRSAGNGSTNSHLGRGTMAPTAPVKKLSSSVQSQSQKLPAIARASGVAFGPQFGLTNSRPPAGATGSGVGGSSGPSMSSASGSTPVGVSQRGVTLPRLANKQGLSAPSPPPLALKNSSMPQFSRLHKR